MPLPETSRNMTRRVDNAAGSHATISAPRDLQQNEDLKFMHPSRWRHLDEVIDSFLKTTPANVGEKRRASDRESPSPSKVRLKRQARESESVKREDLFMPVGTVASNPIIIPDMESVEDSIASLSLLRPRKRQALPDKEQSKDGWVTSKEVWAEKVAAWCKDRLKSKEHPITHHQDRKLLNDLRGKLLNPDWRVNNLDNLHIPVRLTLPPFTIPGIASSTVATFNTANTQHVHDLAGSFDSSSLNQKHQVAAGRPSSRRVRGTKRVLDKDVPSQDQEYRFCEKSTLPELEATSSRSMVPADLSAVSRESDTVSKEPYASEIGDSPHSLEAKRNLRWIMHDLARPLTVSRNVSPGEPNEPAEGDRVTAAIEEQAPISQEQTNDRMENSNQSPLSRQVAPATGSQRRVHLPHWYMEKGYYETISKAVRQKTTSAAPPEVTPEIQVHRPTSEAHVQEDVLNTCSANRDLAKSVERLKHYVKKSKKEVDHPTSFLYIIAQTDRPYVVS
ncbi:hypothetical protein MMC13_003391 [Lambiella insularis]|nr:hypothetical protein [Lambiella insularis]